MNEVKVCQCCGQKMMIYRRSVRKCMLFCLRKMFFKYGQQYIKTNELEPSKSLSSNFELLAYWNLIRSNGASKWCITDFGIDFIQGRVQIKKYIFIYNQTVQADPVDEINPLIFCWDIAPQEISKEIVLNEASSYPRRENGNPQLEFEALKK